MKRLLVALVLALVTLANAADAYLVIPTARGTNLPACLEGIRVAKANGFQGVVLNPGTLQALNPEADQQDLRTAAREVLLYGLKAHWRLGVRWAGDKSPRPDRPLESSWPAIAQIWQKTRDTLASVAAEFGVSGSKVWSFELANEPGLAGANGPQYGNWSTARVAYAEWKRTGDAAYFLKAFPEEFYGKPEGYIEPGFWRMMNYLRGRVLFGGYPTEGVNFEGDHLAEIESTQGADAQRFFAGCSGFGINKYGADSRSVWFYENGKWVKRPANPTEAAQRWSERLATSLGWARANPILSPSRFQVYVSECGFLSSYAAPGWTANEYRTAIIKKAKSFPGIRMAGLFTFKATDPLGDGYAVGSAVTP